MASLTSPQPPPSQPPEPPSQSKNSWSLKNENLLKEWAQKAIIYRWLHHRVSVRYSNRSQVLTILIAILSYVSGGSVLSTDLGQQWVKYFVGYLAILGGVLTNINGLVAWKQLAEKHKIISTQFSSFERSISSMLSINDEQRANAIEFINLKRKEMDDMITNAPNIPASIIREYETKNELTDCWVIFYYVCCCNETLRKRLLQDPKIDNEVKYTTNPNHKGITPMLSRERATIQRPRPRPRPSLMSAPRPDIENLVSTA